MTKELKWHTGKYLFNTKEGRNKGTEKQKRNNIQKQTAKCQT